MIQQTFKYFDISPDAIINNEFPGFKEDYLILDSLLRKYKPESVFEIGCNFGTGTNIICNALPDAKVFSLDMPYGRGDLPLYSGGKDHTGQNCKLPFTLLRGDSTEFDYSKYPCQAYFVDAGHFYENVLIETKKVLAEKPLIVIYHDSDIPEVMQGILDGMNEGYELYRVTDTRIAYLLIK